MSYGYADIRRSRSEVQPEMVDTRDEAKYEQGEAKYEQSEAKDVTALNKGRSARGTSPFPQVKMSRATYDALKVVASLSGRTVPQMLEHFVNEGVDGFKNMTVEQLLSRGS